MLPNKPKKKKAPPSSLSILKRQILCEPNWKISRPHINVFFPLLPTKQHTNSFSLQSFPFTLFHIQTNTL